MDKELGSDVFLDGIVAVIDAKNGLQVKPDRINLNKLCRFPYFQPDMN